MRKLWIILSAAALCVGCSDIASRNNIGFVLKSVMDTKAAPITATSMESSSYGEFLAEAYASSDGSSAISRFSAKYADSKWSTGTYWPENPSAVLDFWCFAPKEALDTVKTKLSGKSLSFRYEPYHDASSGKDAEGQQDILVSCAPNCAIAVSSKIPVHFYHALSAVRIAAGVFTDFSEGDQITINSITLSNLCSCGTCTATYAADTLGFLWSGTATGSYKQSFSNTYTVSGTSPYTVNSYLNTAEKTFMLIPQTVTSSSSITVDWSLNGEQLSSRVCPFVTTQLKAGKVYVLTINMSSRGKTVKATLNAAMEWDTENRQIDYSTVVTGDKALSFSGGPVDETNHIVTFENNWPVTGTFRLSTPKGSTFMVKMKGDFDAFSLTYPSSQVIDGTTDSKFIITPLISNPERDYSVTLQISLKTASGRMLNADNIVQGTDAAAYYTIILPKVY